MCTFAMWHDTFARRTPRPARDVPQMPNTVHWTRPRPSRATRLDEYGEYGEYGEGS